MQIKKKDKKKTFSGDSLIEVLLGITIFSAVSVGGIAIMNSGLNQAQRSLEITMARNEIDAQAEALRFIHNNYVAERELSEDKWQFTDLWNAIIDNTMHSDKTEFLDTMNLNNADSCEQAYKEQFSRQSGLTPFIINTRFVQPRGILVETNAQLKYQQKVVPEIIITSDSQQFAPDNDKNRFKTASTYPRLIYSLLHIPDTAISDSEQYWYNNTTTEGSLTEETVEVGNYKKIFYRRVSMAEGIWILGIQGDEDDRAHDNTDNPEYYDFYIRTCWNSAGMKTHSTLTTTVRLYNPGVID